jgi:hypothetical protein
MDSPDVTTVSPTTRSRLINGSELFLAAVDGRSREARRYRDVFAGLVAHLGGEDHAGVARLHLAKRATALVVWCELAEAALATGSDLDVATFTTATNNTLIFWRRWSVSDETATTDILFGSTTV